MESRICFRTPVWSFSKRRYSLSAVRISAVISTAIPADATAKNILGMKASMATDP
jgi:hypothetical protein